MIRPFTLLTALLAAFAGAYLFAVKHRAQVLDDQLASIAEQSRLDGQRIRVLQAQWAIEIDPTRLSRLAGQFTTLSPMKPAQLITLSALSQALPAPGSAAPGQNPDGGMLDASPDPFTTILAANGLPLPPPEMPGPAPVVVASAAAPAGPAPAGPADVAAAPTAPAPTAPAPGSVIAAVSAPGGPTPKVSAVVATLAATPRPSHMVSRLATPRAGHAPVFRLAQNLPAPQPYESAPRPQPVAQVVAVQASVPASIAAPGGSMLGLSSETLAPPQPFDGTPN